MKYIFRIFSIIFFFSAVSLYGQFTIDGHILDASSQMPIPDLNIHIKGKEVGTISNSGGDFTITVDGDSVKLIFNHIGYKEKEVEFIRSNIKLDTIVLEPRPIELNEVVVTNINLKNIIENVFRTGLDRLQFKVDADFFYRQKTIIGNELTEFIEAFYKGRISVQGVDEIKLFQGRNAKIPSSDKRFTPSITNFYYFSSIPIIQENIKDVIFPINVEFADRYEYSIVNIIENGENGSIAVIEFIAKESSKPIFEGKVYVNLLDLSAIKMEGEIKNQLGLEFTDSSYKAINSVYSFNISFNNLNEELPLFSSIKVGLSFDLYHEGHIKPVRVESSLIAYKYNQTYIKKGIGKIQKNRNLILDIKRKKYDSTFWRNNPIIMRTPEEEDAIELFEQNNLFSIDESKN